MSPRHQYPINFKRRKKFYRKERGKFEWAD
jgi:hypothetical protein